MLPPILNFLNREHYQIYYTPIARLFKSIEAAILLSEFVQRFQYHHDRNELREIPDHGDGWFYHSKPHIEERTGIGDRQFRNAMKILEEHNILHTVSYGMPYKKYYKLNMEGIEELSNKLSTSYTVYQQEKIDNRTENEQVNENSNKLSTRCTVPRQGGAMCTDTSEQAVPTPSLYIKEPKEDPKKRKDIGAGAPPPPSFDEQRIERATHVSTTEKQHQALVAKHGEEFTQACYVLLSEWKQDTPRSKWKKHDSRSIDRWVVEAVQERRLKNKKSIGNPDENKNLANKVASKYKNRQDIILGHDYIEFVNGPTSEHIRFNDNAFKERLANQLRKRNL